MLYGVAGSESEGGRDIREELRERLIIKQFFNDALDGLEALGNPLLRNEIVPTLRSAFQNGSLQTNTPDDDHILPENEPPFTFGYQYNPARKEAYKRDGDILQVVPRIFIQQGGRKILAHKYPEFAKLTDKERDSLYYAFYDAYIALMGIRATTSGTEDVTHFMQREHVTFADRPSDILREAAVVFGKNPDEAVESFLPKNTFDIGIRDVWEFMQRGPTAESLDIKTYGLRQLEFLREITPDITDKKALTKAILYFVESRAMTGIAIANRLINEGRPLSHRNQSTVDEHIQRLSYTVAKTGPLINAFRRE